MSKYALAEPGVDPITNPIGEERSINIPWFWVAFGVFVLVMAAWLIFRPGKAKTSVGSIVSSSTPTIAQTSTNIQRSSPTVTPTITHTATDRVVLRLITSVPVQIRVPVQQTVLVTVVITRVRVITTTPLATQTPWIVIVTETPTPTDDPTQTETPTPTDDPTQTETPTPTETLSQ